MILLCYKEYKDERRERLHENIILGKLVKMHANLRCSCLEDKQKIGKCLLKGIHKNDNESLCSFREILKFFLFKYMLHFIM